MTLETSIFLARVIGLVGTVSSIAVLLRYKEFINLEVEAVNNKLYVVVSGFVFLVLGALLVVSHSVWIYDWRLVITLLGWAVFIKGLLRILFPDFVKKLIERKRNNKFFILGEISMLILGIYLLYYGFIVY